MKTSLFIALYNFSVDSFHEFSRAFPFSRDYDFNNIKTKLMSLNFDIMSIYVAYFVSFHHRCLMFWRPLFGCPTGLSNVYSRTVFTIDFIY